MGKLEEEVNKAMKNQQAVSKSVTEELNKMFEEALSTPANSVLEQELRDSVKESKLPPLSGKNRKGIDVDAYEEALKTLTANEKEFALLHEMTYRNIAEIQELKAAYSKAYKFTFKQRLVAAFNLLFRNKITDKLEVAVLRNIPVPKDSVDQLFVAGSPIDKRPLKYATQDKETLLSTKLKEAGVEVPPTLKSTLEFEDLNEEVSSDLEKNLQDSLDRMTPPTIVETITINANGKSKAPAKRKTLPSNTTVVRDAPRPKRKPKVTPSVEKKKKK